MSLAFLDPILALLGQNGPGLCECVIASFLNFYRSIIKFPGSNRYLYTHVSSYDFSSSLKLEIPLETLINTRYLSTLNFFHFADWDQNDKNVKVYLDDISFPRDGCILCDFSPTGLALHMPCVEMGLDHCLVLDGFFDTIVPDRCRCFLKPGSYIITDIV